MSEQRHELMYGQQGNICGVMFQSIGLLSTQQTHIFKQEKGFMRQHFW